MEQSPTYLSPVSGTGGPLPFSSSSNDVFINTAIKRVKKQGISSELDALGCLAAKKHARARSVRTVQHVPFQFSLKCISGAGKKFQSLDTIESVHVHLILV